MKIPAIVLLASACFAHGAESGRLDLLDRLTAAGTAKIQTTNASVYRDETTKAITLTFHYAKGEPEVVIPLSALGWPTDWSRYRSVQYTFETTSLETLAIAFSDGTVTKAFVTEPLPGIRIHGVIPFHAFVQTRTMTPLLPLAYKVWPNRLFTFQRVDTIAFRMRYPNEPAQLTLYNLTLREDVPEDDSSTASRSSTNSGSGFPRTGLARHTTKNS
jgi:hypothetical protein